MSTGLFFVKALFEYSSPHEDDLQFNAGQIITVTDQDDDEWYTGEYVDETGGKQEGIFPRNFVERYEPTAPPRPTRRVKRDSVPPPPPPPQEDVAPPPSAPPVLTSPITERQLPPPLPFETEQEEKATVPSPATLEPPPPTVPIPQQVRAPEPKPSPPTGTVHRNNPPPIAEKPASSSIRDRIAAFNKSGGGPITPFKPSSLNYVKKPFVPPPPSRDAYVPPPRAELPPRMYIREEDPNIRKEEPSSKELAEPAGTGSVSISQNVDDREEDQPKPTSLQERIALLQKQQAEAAQRHAEALAKKEKPKRPQKKRADISETSEHTPALDHGELDNIEGRVSLDEHHAIPAARRRSTRDALSLNPNDGNEADMSGAGDTTEGAEDLTEREEADDKPRPVSHPNQDDEMDEEDDDQEEDDDIDPEIRRKEELRARMAKMSGGMGMPGMFMPVAAPTLPKKKRRSIVPKDQSYTDNIDESSPVSRVAPPVPTLMALPGMSTRQSVDHPRVDISEEESAPKLPPHPISDDSEEYPDYDQTRKSPLTLFPLHSFPFAYLER